MIKLDVLDQKGKVTEQIELSNEVFGAEVNTYLIHHVATAQANNARQGTQSTLTVSEVRGHAKKPYRQKGTGNARHGNTKAPQYRGGGMAFGIAPRDYTTKINKKQNAAAFISAISGKVADKELLVIKDVKMKEAKTKNVAKIMENLKITNKTLFVTDGMDEAFVKASANIPNVFVTTAQQLSVLDIVTYKYVVATVAGVKSIEEARK